MLVEVLSGDSHMGFDAKAYRRYEEDTSAFARGQEDYLLEQRSLKKGKNIGIKIGFAIGKEIGLALRKEIRLAPGKEIGRERKLTISVLACHAHGMNAEEIAEILEEPLADVERCLARR